MVTALDRYDHAKDAWADRRKQWTEDAKMVNVVGGQWDQAVADRRQAAGKPVLEFNEEHTFVQQVVNRARQDRPQPRVTPGDDDATPEAAEFYEGRLRHIQYASQADVAYDQAVDGAATGGFGFYRVECEYVDFTSRRGGRPSANQEPRIKRILDPLTQYPDPKCEEPDFSDAKHWFDRGWMDRDAYRSQFNGHDPIDFDSDCDPEWVTEDQVCVARYWEVRETPRAYVWLLDGTEGYRPEVEELLGRPILDDEIANERDDPKREIWCHIIDGEKKLKSTLHPGNWIPIIPVLGRQVVVEGKQYLISVVRFGHGAQRLKNAYKCGIANLLQLASTAPWTGPRGMFKDKRWSDANEQNYATLEWDPVYGKNDDVLPFKPERNTFEAPIQALAASSIAASDDLKRSVGYADDVLQPSKTNLSGVAVERRTQQQSLNNFHYQDNLVRSQFHCARVVLDLDMALADTPRMLKARKEDGTTYSRPVHQAADDSGEPQFVPGQDPAKHIRLDRGRFDLTVISGPSYATRQEEERDVLLQILQTDPQAWSLYRDVVFKLMGYRDLEERAKLALPPQILQAMQAGEQGIPPHIQGMLAQLAQEKQQLSQVVQKLIEILKTKKIETDGKLDVERMKLIRELMVIESKNQHDATGQLLGHRTHAAEHMLNMLHESELAPDPSAILAPAAAGGNV
jgi:hypothetical protein